MKRRRNPAGLEYHVDDRVFKSFDAAAGFAVAISAATGRGVDIDVITWTRAAAKAYAGAHGAEVYDEDPDASVHDRIQVQAEATGRRR